MSERKSLSGGDWLAIGAFLAGTLVAVLMAWGLWVEVQGTEHRLIGTAETQYEEWQRLLEQIFISETGFVPEDIRIYAEPEAETEVQPGVEIPPESQEGVANAAGGTGTGA
jgi:hypothetical protein